MVAKKTAVPQSASRRTTGAPGGAGAAAKDVNGKKSTRGAAKTARSGAGASKRAASKAAATGADAAPGSAGAKAGASKRVTARESATGTARTKTSATKTAATKEAAGQTAATKSAGEKTATKEAASKVATKKAAAGEAVTKKAAAKEGAPKGASDKKAAVKKTGSKEGTDKGAAGKKRSVTRTRTAKKTVASAAEGAAEAAKTTGATTVVAKKTPGTATAAGKATAVPKARLAAAEPGELAVRPGEDPWTSEEVAEARAELLAEVVRLGAEITNSEESLAGLMRDSGDGAGDDQADTGTKNITREHEMALAANAREMLEQSERALERLDAGTYGLCENCGNPIGKARMQAFPRATLCVECKQKTERRY
ncbi:TraR/DksA C4-type zinc finger protein [Streptomyces xiangluensis]|uniref:TraR/DksA C4-type zinc finger protein n=1 Tax=Streptomyces xiangluensis TaxID=2665720 RepID=A0ABV8YVT3_9ACTN